ncbi:hypothetical protein C7S20_00030 [Christiangramia fulva]|uniref:DUF5689 domain-containing protein n=1 Tax=Christiangramia fulva TaxID=2126553 RepID=A0A2R3Z0K1_9FLAO|nr:hypothetical protein [Christiangramia fulva]AVR43786.1 hypothetical protein C7S20_00030 [Christiangramia fulva]
MKTPIYFLLTLSLLLVGCAKDDVNVPEAKTYAKFDTSLKAHDKAGATALYTDDVINITFLPGTTAQSKTLFRSVISDFEANLSVRFNEVYAADEKIKLGSLHKGDVVAIKGNTGNIIGRTVITPDNEVRDAYNLAPAISDSELVINFKTASFTDLVIKYTMDGNYVEGQVDNGIQAWQYGEFAYVDNTLTKVRNETISIGGFPTERMHVPAWATLGKTRGDSIWNDEILFAESLDQETVARLLAYELGQESALDGPVNFEELTALGY